MEAGGVQVGDDHHLDLSGILCAERLDPGNSPLSGIEPRFLAVDDSVIMTSTVLDRSIRGQSFPGMKRSSFL